MPDFSLELKLNGLACGLDEVGRGPLAGPVIAACVYIPRELHDLPLWGEVNDSKKIAAKKRDVLAAMIKQTVPYGIGSASVAEIDRHNILQASFMAMERAYSAMIRLFDQPISRNSDLNSDHRLIGSSAHLTALIDGNRTPKNFPIPTMTVIKGDGISVSIAAASIIAKVARDALMCDLAQEYPMYGWAGNAGYGTTAHLRALASHGPCPHHRRSFAPIRDLQAISTV